jgi:putative thiamine transport system ATP-binding protein
VSAALELVGVEIRHRDRILVPRFDLAVEAGCVATVMGPSGTGKSTLLAFVGGFLDPVFAARGKVLVAGRDVTALPPEARGIGLLFQDDMLFPHLDVGANLAFGLSVELRGRAARQAAIAAALHSAGLAGFERRDPATLSGGQRARVAALRALLAAPRALLLDEPFASLDAGLRAGFRAFLLARLAELRVPGILVTHDPDDAAAAGGAIVRLPASPPVQT